MTSTYLVDRVDLRSLPKVSLHDHLDGGLRPATIIELAAEAGLALPVESEAELAEWFRAKSDSGSLVDYLKTFDVTCMVMQTRAGLERVAREAVVDLASDGVIWAELRWAPEQHLAGGLGLDEVVEAVQAGIDAGIDEAASMGRAIGVGQLITAMRHADRGLEIAQLAVRHRDNGVVGFDLAGAEAGFPARRFRDAFDYLAAEMMPRTVHAGEADGLDSIRSALVDGRALRLGHGVRLAEDVEVARQDDENTYVSLGRIAEWVRNENIALELSVSSNLQTGAIEAWGEDIDDHPFDLLYQLGFNVTVNTDNRLMSATSLSRELALLADTFDYDLGDIEAFELNAARSAFCPVDEREALEEAIMEGFREASA